MAKIKEVNKDYFSMISSLVNRPDYNISTQTLIEPIQLNEKYISDISHIHSIIKKDGFLIAEFSKLSTEHHLQCVSFLSALLGEPLRGKHSSGKSFAKVQSEINAKFYVNSNVAQPVHTDEGHTTLFPQYVALYCVREAKEGGDSIVVPFNELYAELSRIFKHRVDLLFTKEALTIETYQGITKKPLLIQTNNNIGITYSPVLNKMWCTEDVFNMFDYITKYIHNISNQIRFKLKSNQVLIFDNCKVLHGRTAFPADDQRLLYRYWFNQGRL